MISSIRKLTRNLSKTIYISSLYPRVFVSKQISFSNGSTKIIKKHSASTKMDFSHKIASPQLKAEQLTEIKYNFNSIIFEYPFKKIPFLTLQELKNLSLPEETFLKILAWQCLQIKDKQQLKKAQQLLLPQQFHLQFTQKKISYNGENIFSSYFEKQLPQIIQKINSPETTSIDTICLFNTLCHMKASPKLKQHALLIKKRVYNKENPLLLAFMINLKIKNRLPYLQNLEEMEKMLRNINKENYKENIRAVYALSMLPNFYQHYQKNMIKAIFYVLRITLKLMNNETAYICLKKVYKNNSKYALRFAEDMINFIISTDPSQGESKASGLLPLIFKVINYCFVLKVPFERMIIHIISHIQQYKTVAQEEGLTLPLFTTKLLSQCKAQFSPQYIKVIQNHIKFELERFKTKSEIDEQQFLSIVQLLYSFRYLLSREIKLLSSSVILQLLTNPSFQDANTLYQSLSFILSQPILFKDVKFLTSQQKQTIKSLAQKYFKQSCRSFMDTLYVQQNINQCINIVCSLQNCSLQFPQNDLPDICKIQFKELTNYSMNIQTLENIIKYLIETRKNDQQIIKEMMKQLENIIYSSFNFHKINLKTTLRIAQLAAIAHIQNNNLYNKIQTSIFEQILKYPEFALEHQDLKIIKESMIDRGFSNQNFKEMITKALENNSNWQEVKNNYIAKQTAFQQKLKAKKIAEERRKHFE